MPDGSLRRRRAALLVAVTTLTLCEVSTTAEDLRRPVAIAVSADEQQVFVANRDRGSIAILNTTERSFVRDIHTGGRLTDILAVDKDHLLAADEERHAVLFLQRQVDDEWLVSDEVSVAPFPVSLAWNAEAATCYVSSLWSRTVSAVALQRGPHNDASAETSWEVHLTFEPKELCFSKADDLLFVAGAHGGQLAVIDTSRGVLQDELSESGHNIGGLAVAPKDGGLWMTRQQLNRLARSTRDDIHWGNLISNELVLMARDVAEDRARLAPERIEQLGEPGRGAGDPGSVCISANDDVAVALCGVHEVAVRREMDSVFRRIGVGDLPSDLAFANGDLYVSRQFSDSVAVINVATTELAAEVPLGSKPELTAAQMGEAAFLDARLAHDGWMSCHSCHPNGHTNGLLNDNQSDGTFDAPKRVLSLLGAHETGPWAWTGTVTTLEDQVTNSIERTMQGGKPTQQIVNSITTFLKTLNTPPPLKTASTPDVIALGQQLFHEFNCHNCHAPPTYTSGQRYDVGLDDGTGNTRFNPPSLRSVGRRKVFFHDGRAESLSEVFTKYRHQLPRKLTAEEQNSLLQFLESI